MRNIFKKTPRRLPTILGLLFLLASLVVGVILTGRNQSFFLKANPEFTPREVRITNISYNSFVVSWVTTRQVSAFVKVEAATGGVFADDRDQISGQLGKFTTHYVTAKNLLPSTKYFFKIGSGGKFFDNEGKPFEVTTAPTLQLLPPAADPAYGAVETEEGKPADGAIVYLKLPNVSSQSALVKASGNWLITLSLARSADLSGYASYDQQATVEEVFAQGGNLGTATATFTTKADSPAPTLILAKATASALQGGDLYFSESPTLTLLPTSTPFSSAVSQSSGFGVEPTYAPPATSQFVLELGISYPAEGEFVTSPKPEFFGQGPAGGVLTITLNSPSLFGETQADEQGQWSWSPPADLEPGKHRLLVRYEDDQGQVKTVEHQFSVLAAEESDLPSFTATPSATPPPLVPTAVPTAVPTLEPTLIPTLPPRITQPSTESGVPQPGVLTPTFLLSIMGIGVFILGIFLKKNPNSISRWPNY